MTGQLVVGVDVGGTKVQAVALRPGGTEPVSEARTATSADPESLIESLVSVVNDVAAGAPIIAVGLGVPGFIDRGGIARQAPNLPGVIGVDIAGAVRGRLGVPVLVDNDANCAAWAAFRVDAPDASTIVAVTLGTGIGGGLVVDGRLVHGAHGFAGEPGHMIVDPGGPLCPCGQHGCWEVWASGTGLGRLVDAAAAAGELGRLVSGLGGARPTGRDLMAGFDAGDPGLIAECRVVLDRFAAWVAIGVVNLVNLLDPDCIVFSGGIVEEGEVLIDAIRSAVAAYPTMSSGRGVDLRISAVGPLAGAIGAGLLAGGDVAGR